MQGFRKSEQGFTLVELLIVVAIIGILAAIAIPQFTKYRRNAAVAACNSDLRNCMSEAAAWHAQNASEAINCTDALPGNKLETGGASLIVAVAANGSMGVFLSSDTISITKETTAPLGANNTYHTAAITARIADNSANCTMAGLNE